MPGFTTNGLPDATFPLSGDETIAADTQAANGQSPQSESVTVSQLAGYARPVVNLTDGTVIPVDASLGSVFNVTLGGNRTISNPTNPMSGQTIRIIVRQDTTGTRTLTFGTAFTWSPGAPTLTTTASAVDMLTLVYDGTVWRGTWNAKFA